MKKVKRTITLTYKWERSDGAQITKDQLEYLDNDAIDALVEDLKTKRIPLSVKMESKARDEKTFFTFKGERTISLHSTCKGNNYDQSF